jgi:hypothetical protein
VNDKPKRHWFQFSLRTMLVVTTLAAIPLGRVAYLRQMAVFHDIEHDRHLVKWRQEYESLDKGSGSTASEAREREMYFHHKLLANQYRQAAYRPWTLVKESPEPSP